jgi:hypothetical protein
LEARHIKDPVVLYFADGSTAEVRGHGDFMLDLLCAACRGDATPQQNRQLDLIRQSVGAQEPGGARMTELVRCFLSGPVGGQSTLGDASDS